MIDDSVRKYLKSQGVVSLTFRELSKIFSRNLCVAEIALPMSISSWNFIRVPKAKAMLWARTKFQLEIPTINVITGIVYFREIILESSRNVSETTPWLANNNLSILNTSHGNH